MTSQDLIRLASENVEAWSRGDWELLRAPFSSDVRYYELGTQQRMRGIDQVVASYKAWKTACPDGTGRVTKVFASGNSAALEVIWSGTHTGPLVGPGGTIPATGRSFMVPAAQLITFDGEKIVEFHHYFDMLTMLQQIGLAEKPAEMESIEEVVAAM
jgi:steroid delta-isomerase-like uncharacterized protein